MGYIQSGEVHQFERPELEAHLVAQDAVNGREVRHTFTNNAQSFRAISTPSMVNDKARRVLRQHCLVAHGLHIRLELLTCSWRCCQTRHHLHHLHQYNRIEKMQACKTFGMRHAGSQYRDGQ